MPNLTQLHTNENTVPTIRSDLYDALRFSVLASFFFLSFFFFFFFFVFSSFFSSFLSFFFFSFS